MRRETEEAIRTVSTRKEWPPAEHLRHDAPYTPDVDRARVFLEGEHDLRGAVPPEDDRELRRLCKRRVLLTESRRILS